MFDSLQTLGLQPTRLLYPWDFPGKNTGMGCHFLLQGVFLTQESAKSPVSPALAGGFFNTWEAVLVKDLENLQKGDKGKEAFWNHKPLI